MTGRLIDLSLGMNRKQRVTLEIDQDFTETYNDLQGATIDIEIKKHREKRSLDANSYFWVLAGKLSAKIGISPEEVYRQYIPDIGGNYDVIPVREDRLEQWDRVWCTDHLGRMTVDIGPCRNTPGYHNVKTYIGSSDYDTAQMSRLIDLIVEDCKECGIETLTPGKLDSLKERWGDAQRNKSNFDTKRS